MNWQIGDRAIIIESRYSALIGQKVTITSGLVDGPPGLGRWVGGVLCHMTDIQSMSSPGRCAGFQPHQLGPIPDDDNKEEYDGRKKIIWAECPEWQPKELVVI